VLLAVEQSNWFKRGSRNRRAIRAPRRPVAPLTVTAAPSGWAVDITEASRRAEPRGARDRSSCRLDLAVGTSSRSASNRSFPSHPGSERREGIVHVRPGSL
jgi:hypothetical protein